MKGDNLKQVQGRLSGGEDGLAVLLSLQYSSVVERGVHK